MDMLLTLSEAMELCKIKSRTTFYKRLSEWKQAGLPVPYVNLNPAGKYELRRFKPDLLQQCLEGGNRKNPSEEEGVQYRCAE